MNPMAAAAQAQSHAEELEMNRLGELGRRMKEAGSQNKAELKKAALEFERYMMGQVYKTMYNSVEKSEFSGNPFTRELFMGLYIDESLKKNDMGSRGIAALLMRQYGDKAKPAGPLSGDIRRMSETAARADVRVDEELERLMDESADGDNLRRVFEDLAGAVQNWDKKISSDFGLRLHPIHKVKKFHHGIDYALPHGMELKSPSGGVVRFAGPNGGYGQTVILDHGEGVETVYAHLSEIHVKEGERINKETVLGKIGSTGLSTGPHLHFEIRKGEKPMDPKRLVSGL